MSSRFGRLEVIFGDGNVSCHHFDLASSSVGRLPISTLNGTGDPDSRANARRCRYELILRFPPDDRQDVEAAVRFFGSNRH
jgi:hypothetical protein